MAEDKKKEDKHRTLTEDHSKLEKFRREVDYGESKSSGNGKDQAVTNTHKAPDPIKKK